MNYKILDQILVVQNQYFFDPETLIIFSKTSANDSEEKMINDFQKNKPIEQLKIDSENFEYGNVYLELHVTDDCTFRCRYCYVEEACHKYVKQEMSEEVLEKSFKLALNSFPNAKAFIIVLYGGEPLLFLRNFLLL